MWKESKDLPGILSTNFNVEVSCDKNGVFLEIWKNAETGKLDGWPFFPAWVERGLPAKIGPDPRVQWWEDGKQIFDPERLANRPVELAARCKEAEERALAYWAARREARKEREAAANTARRPDPEPQP